MVVWVLLAVAALGALTRPASVGVLTRQWDPIFRRACPGLPVEFVRALARHESNFNPTRTHAGGSKATGILQVADVVRRDYNARHGTAVEQTDLLRPEVCAKLACELLGRIAAGYARNHPRSLATDWTSRRWVELLVYGWNAGYSEAAGVGYVVGQLDARGIPVAAITIDSVHTAALGLPQASAQLRKPAKVAWCKQVAATYAGELQPRGEV